MEARKHFSKLAWTYIVFFLVANGTQFLLALACKYLFRVELDLNMMMLLSLVCMYLCGFPVFYLCMRNIPTWNMKEKKRLTAGELILWLIFCFGLTYVGNMIGQGVMLGVSMVTGNVIENPVNSMVTGMNPAMMLVSVVIVAPVMEELMFRKFLVDRTVQYGQKVAVIVSGVAFGLFHGNFYQFFYACTMGMVFAYLYSNTGRIRYNILIHMIINFAGGYIPLLLTQGLSHGNGWAVIGLIALGILMIGSIISAIVLACVYAKKLPVFHGWVSEPETGIWPAILLAPGVIAFFVMSVLLFLFL